MIFAQVGIHAVKSIICLIIKTNGGDEIVLLLSFDIAIKLISNAPLNEERRQPDGKQADEEEGKGKFVS